MKEVLYLENHILWNNEPNRLWHVSKGTDKFLCDGNKCNDKCRYYKNFPDDIPSQFSMMRPLDLSSLVKLNTMFLTQSYITEYYILETNSSATSALSNWAEHYGSLSGEGVHEKVCNMIFTQGIFVVDLEKPALFFTA